MVVVRCTAGLLKHLGAHPASTPSASTTRLGDWYATVLQRRPAHLVVLVNEPTRLPVVLPARELSTLAQRIPDAVTRVLLDLGVDASVVDDERRAMTDVMFAKTASRRVLGTMTELVFALGHLRESKPHMTEHALGMKLGQLLVRIPQLGYQHPAEMAKQMLATRDCARPANNAIARKEPPVKSPASIYQLKITLRDVKPPIWRRVRVRSDITLFKLHSILQLVMGWMDGHLHQFVARDKFYGLPDPEFPEPRGNEKKVLLSQVLRKPKDSLAYEYDFGDGWDHRVVLEQVLEAEAGAKYPYVVAGKRACPPEDCGGTGGYARLLDVLADDQHPEHAEMVEWVGGSFDPEAFDADEINRAFHGGWFLPPEANAPRSKTTLPRQMTLKLGVKSRRR